MLLVLGNYYLVSEEVPESSYLLNFLLEEQTKILIWRAWITMDLFSGECLDFPPYSLDPLLGNAPHHRGKIHRFSNASPKDFSDFRINVTSLECSWSEAHALHMY